MMKYFETDWITSREIEFTGFGCMVVGFDEHGFWLAGPFNTISTDINGLSHNEVRQFALRVYDSQSEKTKENLDTILEALG
jgi:hypothetical protein